MQIGVVKFNDGNILFFRYTDKEKTVESGLENSISMYDKLEPNLKCKCNNQEEVEGRLKIKGESYIFKTKACKKCRAINLFNVELIKGEIDWEKEIFTVLQNEQLKSSIKDLYHMVNERSSNNTWKESPEEIIGLFQSKEKLPKNIGEIKDKIFLLLDEDKLLKLVNRKDSKVYLSVTGDKKAALKAYELLEMIVDNKKLEYYLNDTRLIFIGAGDHLDFQLEKEGKS